MSLLVADGGGAHARIGFADIGENGKVELAGIEVVSTQSVSDFADLAAKHWREQGSPALEGVAVCAAGPVEGEGDDARVELTNARLTVSAASLAKALGLPQAVVVNDWAAIAAAIPALGEDDLFLHGAAPLPAGGTVVALGPGTGLGVSARLKNGALVVGEGGHVRLAPPDEASAALWALLADDGGFVSAERVLSGGGLHHLYLAVVLKRGGKPAAGDAAGVWDASRAGDAAAAEAVQRFTVALGAYAGDLALIFNADAVLIGGGILPRWGRDFDLAAFREAFAAKEAHYRPRLARLPTATITHEYPGLIGLARLAADPPGRTATAAPVVGQ